MAITSWCNFQALLFSTVSDQNTNEAETKDKLLNFMCVDREGHMAPIHSSAHMVSVFLCLPHIMHASANTDQLHFRFFASGSSFNLFLHCIPHVLWCNTGTYVAE